MYRGLVVHVTDSHNANTIINTLLKQMCRSKWLAVGQVGCYCGDLVAFACGKCMLLFGELDPKVASW